MQRASGAIESMLVCDGTEIAEMPLTYILGPDRKYRTIRSKQSVLAIPRILIYLFIRSSQGTPQSKGRPGRIRFGHRYCRVA